jgi:hypothetical protein
MKNNYRVILILLCILQLNIEAQSFELVSPNRDTINMINAEGKKQGHWVVLGRSKPKDGYMPEQKIEEGNYKDNKKTGIWTQYYKNGNVKNVLTFEEGRPNGPAKTFYESGKPDEEGTWKNNRWVGKYKKYTEDGKWEEFTFDANGKREGADREHKKAKDKK